MKENNSHFLRALFLAEVLVFWFDQDHFYMNVIETFLIFLFLFCQNSCSAGANMAHPLTQTRCLLDKLETP